MSLHPELAEALADPAFSAPPPSPPEGVPLYEFVRKQTKAIVAPSIAYYAARLPSGMCMDLCLSKL